MKRTRFLEARAATSLEKEGETQGHSLWLSGYRGRSLGR